MQRLPAFVLLITLLCAPLAVSAQVYTWTDAQGTVHYADAPPAHDAHYKSLRMAGATAISEAPAGAGNEATTGHADSPDDDPATTHLPDTPANRQKLCDNLEVNMKLLKKNGPVVVRDKNGKNQLLSKQDRASELAREQQKYQAWCTE